MFSFLGRYFKLLELTFEINLFVIFVAKGLGIGVLVGYGWVVEGDMVFFASLVAVSTGLV